MLKTPILSALIKKHLVDHYPRPWFVLAELVGAVFNLGIYWYTSKAFGSLLNTDLGLGETDYFTYVVIGELLVALPMGVFSSVVRNFRSAVSEGTFEIFQVFSARPARIFLTSGVSTIPFDFFKILCTIGIAYFIFGLQISQGSLVYALVLQVLALPCFLGLGLISSSLILITGRGMGLLTSFSSGLVVLAGVYFPISVLPTQLQAVSKTLSPLTLLTESSRQLLAGGGGPTSFDFLLIIIWGLVLVPTGLFTFSWGLRRLREKGEPQIPLP